MLRHRLSRGARAVAKALTSPIGRQMAGIICIFLACLATYQFVTNEYYSYGWILVVVLIFSCAGMFLLSEKEE